MIVEHPHVEVVANHSMGVMALVRGTRVPVARLFSWQQNGVTIATLIKRYPQLGPAVVLDALAFAFDNEEMVRADWAKLDAAVTS